MLNNYFKIAWRNLIRNKAFSAINIIGLALGMACSLLILLWVQDERSVDGFHANGKQLYQVYERQYYDGKVEGTYLTQGLLAGELKSNIPEIQYATPLEQKSPTPYTFEAGGKVIKLDGSFAGVDFFKMFSYTLLGGDAETALNIPAGIAISRKMAEQFFGSPQNAMGKNIRFENRETLMVTAVFENPPANSSQQFDFLRNWQDYAKTNPWVNSWGSANPATYLLLRKDADPIKVGAKIKDFVHRYTAKSTKSFTELALQPYAEKYLYSAFENGRLAGGRIEYVKLFSIIAVVILLIACINFMNLATARAAKRAKEVGIRKVIGAVRSVLIKQFIGEGMLVTLLSVIVAVIFAIIFLPGFNNLTGKQLSLPVMQPSFWFMLLCLLLITGFVAGSYPALFLSSLKPVRVLKGTLKFSPGSSFFRKGLVVFQFSLSIILIVGVMVIYRQVNYAQSKNLGYDRENLLYLPIEGELIKKYALFKTEASQLPGILNVSRMKESPTVIGHHRTDIAWTAKDPNLTTSFADAVVGFGFLKTMKLQLIEGRDFSDEFSTDSSGYMLNETAVKKIGYQNPVGKSMWWGDREGKIIGVFKDFHFNSMHQAIEPLILRVDENVKWGTILVRTEAGKTKQALAGLEKLCKTVNPGFPFTYQFSDEAYSKLYESEKVVSKLAGFFAFLAIFISSLGLFGLATFAAGQRRKEIGIRKVLGASVSGIAVLLSANFLKPVLVAFLVALPLSWYATNQWLKNFAYKADVAWWIFALAGLLILSIALVTVSYQSIKAALLNPVKSLRTE